MGVSALCAFVALSARPLYLFGRRVVARANHEASSGITAPAMVPNLTTCVLKRIHVRSMRSVCRFREGGDTGVVQNAGFLADRPGVVSGLENEDVPG